MNTSPTCDEERESSSAERYVTGRMTADGAEAFEDHFVSCAACQGDVRFASALVGGLPRTPALLRPPKRSLRAWVWGGGGLALAAGLATVVLLQSGPRGQLVALGGVREPPAYLGIPVRGADTPQDSLFESAMNSYAQQRYGAAIHGLRTALAAGQDSVPVQFFLATSLLFESQPRDAIVGFDQVLAHGATPYRAEASYYRAKALLRMARADDALSALARLSPADGIVYEMGQVLADSVRKLRAR